MTEWPKVHDWKSCELARVPRVRIPLSPLTIPDSYDADGIGGDAGVGDSVCTSVCTPPCQEAVLEAAIHRLTAALGTASDEVIADLVAERRALREELRLLREGSAGMVHLDDKRTWPKRGP